MTGPCGNEDCDRCYPQPRWRVSQHRVQHLTHARAIKASTPEEARRIYDEGTAWPTQYDDEYGEIVQLDEVQVEAMPTSEREREYGRECCYHDLSSHPDTARARLAAGDGEGGR